LNVLHDDTRTSDPSTWRASLDEVFDTDVFLKYLATNTVIQNWDTYGRMTHNYLLYNDPDTDKLTWIPWDNNESLQTGKQGGALSLDFSNLQSSEWPLIEYLYQDDVYRNQYNTYVQEVIDGPFHLSNIDAKYTENSTLIEPYATSEVDGYSFLNSGADFYNAVSELMSHLSNRSSVAEQYLENY